MRLMLKRSRLLLVLALLLAFTASVASAKPKNAVRELIEKRSATSKTWQNSDGSLTAEISSSPIHYKDGDGKWKDIDTSFCAPAKSSYHHSVVKNLLKVHVGQSSKSHTKGMASTDEITVDSDEASLSFIPEMQSPVSPIVSKNTLTYQNAWPSTDLRYTVLPSALKEEIILQNNPGPFTYRFSVDHSGLSLQRCSDSSFKFINQAGKECFSMSPVYMMDAEGNISNGVEAIVQPTADGSFELSLTPDPEWLANAAYPVVIDPTFGLCAGPAQWCWWVVGPAGWGTSPYDDLNIGTIGTQNRIGCIRWNLSCIPASSQILDASLLLAVTGTGVANGGVYRLLSPMDGSAPPSIDSNVIVSGQWTANTNWVQTGTPTQNVSLLNLVQNWVNGTWPSYGLALKSIGTVSAYGSVRAASSEFIITYQTAADSTPPTTPVIDTQNYLNYSSWELWANWFSSDPESGIASYQFAVGMTANPNYPPTTDAERTNIQSWTNTGTNPYGYCYPYLQEGMAYFFSVKATNGAGLTSMATQSQGTLMDSLAPQIGQVVVPRRVASGSVTVPYSGVSDATPPQGVCSGVSSIYLSYRRACDPAWASNNVSATSTQSSGCISFTPFESGVYLCSLCVQDNAGNYVQTPEQVLVYGDASMESIKLLPNGESTGLIDGVVTAVFPGRFYIETPDRLTGIPVIVRSTSPDYPTAQSLTVGMTVRIQGFMGTDSSTWERYVDAISVSMSSPGSVEPLAMTNEALGGADFYYDQATGAGQCGVLGGRGWNNLGLLVRTCGTVKSVDITNNVIEISDGSFKFSDFNQNPNNDYSELNLQVQLPSGVNVPLVGDHVIVTGISSCQAAGSVNRLLKVRTAADLQVVAGGHPAVIDLASQSNYFTTPLAPFDPDPATVLSAVGSDITNLYRMDPFYGYISWNDYDMYGRMLLGDGLGISLSQATSVSYTGYPSGLAVGSKESDMVVPLPGNPYSDPSYSRTQLIGNPFDRDVPLDSGSHMGDLVWFTDGTSVKTYGEAVDASWCDSHMWALNAATQNYISVGYDEYADSNILKAGQACWIYTYRDNLAMIIPGTASYGIVSAAKEAADESRVSLSGVVVTAVFPNSIYVESADRSSGICVEGAIDGISVGDKVNIAGIARTNTDAERYVYTTAIVNCGTGSIAPLATNNQSLGGGNNGMQAGITGACGWNNIGMLVRTCGTVKSVDNESNIIEISDGSISSNGTDVAIKVLAVAGTTLPSVGNNVIVTGISSCRASGNAIERLLRVRDADSLVCVSSACSTSISLASGWNFIALPSVPFDPKPTSVFSVMTPDELDCNNLKRWDPSYGEVVFSLLDNERAAFGNLVMGGGYQLYTPTSRTVIYSGYPVGLSLDSPVDTVITLTGNHSDNGNNGASHLFGYPYTSPLTISNGSEILFTDGVSTKTWAEAIQAQWVSPTISYYTGSGYDDIWYDGTSDETQLKPCASYWIATNIDNLAMIILSGAVDTQDITPPTEPVVTDDGVYTASTNTLHAVWTACADPDSGISRYEYAIGTTSGGTDITNGYQSNNTSTEVNRSDLTLSDGKTYFFTVRAYNGDGAYSEGRSDGITCIQGKVIFVKSGGTGTGTSWGNAMGSINDALENAATAHKQVWVAKGTYEEAITLPVGVKLYGSFDGQSYAWKEHRDWCANATVLTRNDTTYSSLVVVSSGCTADTVFDGFTITNGGYAYEGGAGVCCVDASPVISHNIIVGNQGDYVWYGGGIYCSGGAPTIVENTIEGNSCQNYGGGICCIDSSPQIRANIISTNTCNYGGGVALINCVANSSVIGNTISGNKASSYGGGIFCINSLTKIANNFISNNDSYAGGGIFCADMSGWFGGDPTWSPSILNNTIVQNRSGNPGGICISSNSPVIRNNIIAGNSTGIMKYGTSNPTVDHNCIFETTPYYGWSADEPDYIPDNPMLAGVHLQPNSPCINAGEDTAAVGVVDIDGQPRRIDAIDIGADEFNPTDSGIGAPIFNDEMSLLSSLVSYCN